MIFVHLPKTGGSSTERALDPNVGTARNKNAKEVQNTLLKGSTGQSTAYPNVFNQCFKFGFVRNPWERFEDLHRDFDQICDLANVGRIFLPHVNNLGSRLHYSELYNQSPQLIDAVSEHCRWVINTFGYEFQTANEVVDN